MLRHAMNSVCLRGVTEDPRELREWASRWRDNLKKCSCYMCGNRRRFHEGPTFRERRQLHSALAELGPEELPDFAELKALLARCRR